MRKTPIGNSFVYLLAVILAASSFLSAAGPVTHAFLAKRYLEATACFESEQDRASFFQGAFFPDSRYITGGERVSTHRAVTSLAEVLQETDPFIAGMMHHAFVDTERSRLLLEHDVLSAISYTEAEECHSYIKFLEDDRVYPHLDCAYILSLFLKGCKHPLLENFTKAQWIQWQQLLQLCFSYSPRELIGLLAQYQKGIFRFSPELVQCWDASFESDRNQPEVVAFVEHMIAHFDRLNSELME